MHPYLFQSETLTIGTYGVMLAIAYLSGRYWFIQRLQSQLHNNAQPEFLIILLLVSGLIGAKLMYLIKNVSLNSLSSSTLLDLSGFSSQGALVAAFIVLVIYARVKHIKLATLLDAAAPAAILAYMIARIGCLLAGDDCWGKDSTLPWAMSFPQGIAPTAIGQTVHPVPLYEILSSLLILLCLKRIEQRNTSDYSIFLWLLVLWGGARFLVEFVSNNPVKIGFMSGSQFGALLMFIAGFSVLFYRQITADKKKPGNNPG